MKQGTIKTIGAAALGAAIAVTAAGTASAAAPKGPLERVTNLAAGTSRQLPIEDLAPTLPGGPVISAANRALSSSAVETVAGALDRAVFPERPQKAAAPESAPGDNKGNGGLLGLIPDGALPKGLSTPNLSGH
ncbi:ATP-binding protein [Streptomyces huiliensis]|uniref:ATP-binding protein n=1 Tax=Streptomyces huiliensis TaxID=2876027 RepID=UPI001CBA6C58|nr:ATP-binding protein [Streptomyces huiliensis]MBZ4320560.1 ATP-binding protein [Streptomyces huiliensis]